MSERCEDCKCPAEIIITKKSDCICECHYGDIEE